MRSQTFAPPRKARAHQEKVPVILKNKLWFYLVYSVVFLSLSNALAYGFFAPRLPQASSLNNDKFMVVRKTGIFLTHKERFNGVFIGDSRTYQSIDPQVFDRVAGSRSYNLGGPAHWFETQYAQLEDILPLLGPGAVVVWSVGHNNFESPIQFMPDSYPLGARTVLHFLGMGFHWREMRSNFFVHYVQPLSVWVPGLYVYAHRMFFYESLARWLDQPVFSVRPEKKPLEVRKMRNAGAFGKLYLELKKNKHVKFINAAHDGDVITGALVYKVSGVMLLAEIDGDYYRRRQKESGYLPVLEREFEPDGRYVKLFEAMLDLFEKYDVRLAVNEMDYSPAAYGTEANYLHYRGFMDKIRQRVEKRGVPYVRTPPHFFSASDYYDMNHLNAAGAAKYSEFLAGWLKELLG